MTEHHSEQTLNIREITDTDLEAIEQVFQIDLPPSIIDVDEYTALCEVDVDALELLKDLVAKCLNYTVDVSNMERYVREHPGDQDEGLEMTSKKRSVTHGSMISSVNIFSRYLLKQGIKTESFIKWDSENRGAYGRFAILLTLNAFKDNILVDLVRKTFPDGDVNTSALRESANEQELLVLDYVDILCAAEKEDRVLTEEEKDKLIDIERTLSQTADKILGAFHTIYMKRY
jgi:hypothetical protein